MSSHICGLTERAALAWAGTLTLSTENLFTGEASEDKAGPCVIFSSPNATQDEVCAGNYWVDLDILVRGSAAIDTDGEDPATDYDELVTEVFNGFERDDLTDGLSTYAGFACQGVDISAGAKERSYNGDAFESKMRLKLYCCASDL